MPDLEIRGMHKIPYSKEFSLRRRVKNARNRARKPGNGFGQGHPHEFVHHLPCNSYGECDHRKHGARK